MSQERQIPKESSQHQQGGGGIVAFDMMPIDQLDSLLDHRSKAIDVVLKHAMARLRPKHITNQGGKPYVMEDGCMEVLKMLDIQIESPHELPIQKITHEDGITEIIFTMVANARIKGLGVFPAMGVCTSRDDLLGTQNGNPKRLVDVNFKSIKKKMLTNLKGDAVRHGCGLNTLTWEELEPFGITKDKCGGKVDYRSQNKTSLSAEAEVQKNEIQTKLDEMFQNVSQQDEYCQRISSFKDVPGRRLNEWSEKQIRFNQRKVNEDYDRYIQALNAPSGNSQRQSENGKHKPGSDSEGGLFNGKR